jgi:hypothetical protein
MCSCSFERNFLNKPKEAAELCHKYYPVKDLEVKETISTDIVYDTVYRDSIRCPDTLKAVEVLDDKGNKIIDQATGKPKIKYIKVPGETIPCPPSINKTIKTTTTITKKVRDTSQDQIVKDLNDENILLESSNKSKRNWIIVLVLIILSYVTYRVVKSKVIQKLI